MSIRGNDACNGCGRKLPPDKDREWLCRGTGVCYNCARMRIDRAEKESRGRAYIQAWFMALDTHRRIAVGVKSR